MLFRSTVGSGCPACGATHAACGQSGAVNPVDLPSVKERTVGPVRKYKVNKYGYDTILKLNDADAKLYPDAVLIEPADAKAEDKSEVPAKSRRAPNKARGPQADK